MMKGDTAKLQQLIASGADINEKDRNGRTPLHICAALGRDDSAIEFLITKGARINEEDKKGAEKKTNAFFNPFSTNGIAHKYLPKKIGLSNH